MSIQLKLFRDRLTPEEVLAVFTPDDVELTRSEIAARLGVSKGRALIAILDQFEAQGVLVRYEEALINRALVFLYRKA